MRAFGHESPLGAELAAAVVGRVIVHGVELEESVLVAVDNALDGTLDVVDVEVEGAVARLVRVWARARARGRGRVRGRARARVRVGIRGRGRGRARARVRARVRVH